MKFNIFNYNQKKACELKLDLKDLLILDWFQSFQPKMHKTIRDNKQYYWIQYNKLITDIPIIEITTPKGLFKRLQAMCDIGLLEYLPIRTGNGCFSYYLITDKILLLLSDSHSSESSSGSSESSSGSSESSSGSSESSYAIYNSSIINNPIINNPTINPQKIYKKEISLSKKEDLEQIKENHLKENNYSQEEEEAVKEYFDLRYKQHKGLAKTERALKTLLNGIQELKSKGYDVVKVVKKLDRNGNVLQKHELSGRENLYKDCISDVARFNQIVAKEVEKNKTKELEKAVKRKIENEKINQEVIDW